MMLLLHEHELGMLLLTLERSAKDADRYAEEAEAAAAVGYTSGLVADYAPIAQAHREAAVRYRGLMNKLIEQRERAREDADREDG